MADLAELDLDVVPLDRAQSGVMGQLLQATHHAGLSLGDCACLALAATSSRIALTTQRAWAEVNQGVGVAVEFVH